MNLKNIYQPIENELKAIEKTLSFSLSESKNKSILKLGRFLLESPGKRIRPTLVILSAKAFLNQKNQANEDKLTKIASSMELIHMASLLHDDVIDHSRLRHNRSTINYQWGEDIAITFGDYLYSVAFDLSASCGDMDILQCISRATKAMCEGELFQACDRGNLNLLKEQYIVIVKKKTASLFAASCQVGALISNQSEISQKALKEYGLNLGIAFQIADDYLDLIAGKDKLGKMPGQDLKVGDITLPLLNVLESVSKREVKEFKALLATKEKKRALAKIRSRLLDSNAGEKTKNSAVSYMNTAKEKIKTLPSSQYKQGLLQLADFIIERGFNVKC